MSTESKSYFSLTGAAGDDRYVRRSMDQLPEIIATLDEMEARHQAAGSLVPELAVASMDADTIWANYRKGKGTPTTASTLPSAAVDRAEIERRLR